MNRYGILLAMSWALFVMTLPAAGEVIIYDNSDGTFDWDADLEFVDPSEKHYLDPTQPPVQTGELALGGLTYELAPPNLDFAIGKDWIYAHGNMQIAVKEPRRVTNLGGIYSSIITPPIRFQLDQAIGPDANWMSRGDTLWYALNPEIPGWEYHDLIADHQFIGFRTRQGTDYRYGWIELLNVPGKVAYQPIRWAYETELNTPIFTIPEPASSVLFLVGAFAISCSCAFRKD